MKFRVLSALCLLILGSSAVAQECKSGRCPLVQVPQAVASQSIQAVKEVASLPVQVRAKAQTKKPVRGFLRKVFGR